MSALSSWDSAEICRNMLHRPVLQRPARLCGSCESVEIDTDDIAGLRSDLTAFQRVRSNATCNRHRAMQRATDTARNNATCNTRRSTLATRSDLCSWSRIDGLLRTQRPECYRMPRVLSSDVGAADTARVTQRLLRLPLPHAVSYDIPCARHWALHRPTALGTQRLRTHCDCSTPAGLPAHSCSS